MNVVWDSDCYNISLMNMSAHNKTARKSLRELSVTACRPQLYSTFCIGYRRNLLRSHVCLSLNALNVYGNRNHDTCDFIAVIPLRPTAREPWNGEAHEEGARERSGTRGLRLWRISDRHFREGTALASQMHERLRLGWIKQCFLTRWSYTPLWGLAIHNCMLRFYFIYWMESRPRSIDLY